MNLLDQSHLLQGPSGEASQSGCSIGGGRPSEQLVMRRPFGTLWTANEGGFIHTHTHAGRVAWTESILAFDVKFLGSESTYLRLLCAYERVYVLMRGRAKRVNAGMYFSLLLAEWLTHSEPNIRWQINTAGSGAEEKSASERRRACASTCEHIRTDKVQVVWTPAAVVEPCPATGPVLIKKAGRETREAKNSRTETGGNRGKWMCTVEEDKTEQGEGQREGLGQEKTSQHPWGLCH